MKLVVEYRIEQALWTKSLCWYSALLSFWTKSLKTIYCTFSNIDVRQGEVQICHLYIITCGLPSQAYSNTILTNNWENCCITRVVDQKTSSFKVLVVWENNVSLTSSVVIFNQKFQDCTSYKSLHGYIDSETHTIQTTTEASHPGF